MKLRAVVANFAACVLTFKSVEAGMALFDNGNNSMHGFARVLTVQSRGYVLFFHLRSHLHSLAHFACLPGLDNYIDLELFLSPSRQFNISFTGTLQACGDHIVDLVNDPHGQNALNPTPPSWKGDPGSSNTSYVWRTCLVR